MVSIALMGAGCGLAGAAALLYFSGYLSSPTHSRGDLALAAVIGIYPMTFLSVFFNVALAGAAAASFDGQPIGVREALGISWKRLGRIAQWSLLAAGVGMLLEQIASRVPGAGRLASWLLGAAWSLATIFAVPLLALEGVSLTVADADSGRARKVAAELGIGPTFEELLDVSRRYLASRIVPLGSQGLTELNAASMIEIGSGGMTTSGSPPWAAARGRRS